MVVIVIGSSAGGVAVVRDVERVEMARRKESVEGRDGDNGVVLVDQVDGDGLVGAREDDFVEVELGTEKERVSEPSSEGKASRELT